MGPGQWGKHLYQVRLKSTNAYASYIADMNCYERTDGHTVHSYNPSPLHGGGYNREVLYLDINGYKQVF